MDVNFCALNCKLAFLSSVFYKRCRQAPDTAFPLQTAIATPLGDVRAGILRTGSLAFDSGQDRNQLQAELIERTVAMTEERDHLNCLADKFKTVGPMLYCLLFCLVYLDSNQKLLGR